MTCQWCQEGILPEDNPEPIGNMHWECGLRSVIGPVAHLQRRCQCFEPGSTEHDPPGMSRREAAQAAAQLYLKLQALGVKVP